MHNAPVRIVQISDIHLFADPNKSLLGVKTQQSFESLLNFYKKNDHVPHFFIITGDLAQDGSEEAYIRLADMMDEFQIPVYFTPGNHDDIFRIEKLYPRKCISLQRHIVLKHWHLILLDSHVHGAVHGFMDSTQIEFIKTCMDLCPYKQAILVFHHQPIPSGSAWLDRLGLTNSEEFWQEIAVYPNLNTILFGHIHQEHEGEKNGIKYFSTPSTCIQFKTKSNKFALEELPPAYRVVDLYSDGEIKTKVYRMEKYVGKFEADAKGY